MRSVRSALFAALALVPAIASAGIPLPKELVVSQVFVR
jgi:hypothetical protein